MTYVCMCGRDVDQCHPLLGPGMGNIDSYDEEGCVSFIVYHSLYWGGGLCVYGYMHSFKCVRVKKCMED